MSKVKADLRKFLVEVGSYHFMRLSVLSFNTDDGHCKVAEPCFATKTRLVNQKKTVSMLWVDY